MATNATEAPSWSDLPPELLGAVLLHLPSIADRVHVAAVCPSWRAGSMLQPMPMPAPAPWLVLGDRAYLDLGNSAVHSVTIPGDASCRCSIDDWLFLTRDINGCFLVNAFSAAVLPLPDLSFFWRETNKAESTKVIEKVVAPSRLSTRQRHPVIAALIRHCMHIYDYKTICVCKPEMYTAGLVWAHISFAHDIEFFRGKLYGLARTGVLVVFEIGELEGGRPTIDSRQTVIKSGLPIPSLDDCNCIAYLVNSGSGDRLLMVKRWVGTTGTTRKFEIFEADFGADPCRWTEVASLRGHALFVSKNGSKCLPTGAGASQSGVQEDCIYFIHEDNVRDRYEQPGDPLRDSGVYNVRDKTFAPFPTPEAAVPRRSWGSWTPTWLFPTQVR